MSLAEWMVYDTYYDAVHCVDLVGLNKIAEGVPDNDTKRSIEPRRKCCGGE
jgi:hypothetical protein